MTWLNEFIIKYKLSAYFKVDEQLTFIKLFESHMSTGQISMKQAMQKVQATYASIYSKNHIAVEICEQIIRALNTGEDYNALMKKFFHPNIAVGYELAQKVSVEKNAVKGISDLLRIERELVKDSISTLSLPFMLLFLGIATTSAVGHFVLPNLEKNVGTPTQSFERSLAIFMGDAVFNYWYLLLGLVFLTVTCYRYVQDHWVHEGREIADQIWPFSNYRVFWGVRLMQLLGLLKKAGTKDIQALGLIRKYGTPYIIHHIDRMITNAKTGVEKKGSFGHGLLTKTQLVRLETYLDVSDEVFTDGLLSVAEEAVVDVQVQNNKIIKRWGLAMTLVAFFMMGSAVGVILDAGTTMALQL